MGLKYLSFIPLLISTQSQAADAKLLCRYKDKRDHLLYSLQATFKSDRSIKVEKIVNSTGSFASVTVSEAEVNNNPVAAFKSTTGVIRYDIEAASSDAQYHDKYVLYFKKIEVTRFSFSGSLRYTSYSSGKATSDFAEGSCTLK